VTARPFRGRQRQKSCLPWLEAQAGVPTLLKANSEVGPYQFRDRDRFVDQFALQKAASSRRTPKVKLRKEGTMYRAPARDTQKLPEELGEGEGEEGVALFGAEFAVAAGGDDGILFAVECVRHRGGLAPGREIKTPEFGAGVGIEGIDFVVHGSGGKDKAARSSDGATERNCSCLLTRDK